MAELPTLERCLACLRLKKDDEEWESAFGFCPDCHLEFARLQKLFKADFIKRKRAGLNPCSRR